MRLLVLAAIAAGIVIGMGYLRQILIRISNQSGKGALPQG